MQVALIIPPSPFLISDKSFPFLGVLWVAATLREKGIGVEVVDLAGQAEHLAQSVASWARARRPGDYALVGITSTTAQFPYARAILRELKLVDRRWTVGIGGAHPTVQPQSCGTFDHVVMDDGMSGIFLALEPDSPREVTGPLTDMGTWPLPARDLIDMASYTADIQGLRATSVMFSSGCPHRCGFCSGRLLRYYRTQRRRPIDHILYELDHLAATYGLRAFWAFDDEVNINREWLLALCKALGQRGYKWRAFVKAERFTPEVAQAMASGGCVEVGFGAESGSARILETIHKNSTPEINGRVVELARAHGLRVKAFCLVGLPGETRESIQETRDWLLRYRPDDFDLTIYTPYPGSPIFALKYPGYTRREIGGEVGGRDRPLEISFPLPDYSDEAVFYKGIPGHYQAVVSTPALTGEDLVQLRDQVDAGVRRELGIPWRAAGTPVPS